MTQRLRERPKPGMAAKDRRKPDCRPGPPTALVMAVLSLEPSPLHLDTPVWSNACILNPMGSVKDPRGSNKLRLDLARS